MCIPPQEQWNKGTILLRRSRGVVTQKGKLMKSIQVSIVGASGYSGGELLRISKNVMFSFFVCHMVKR
jgi:hypothetical protein